MKYITILFASLPKTFEKSEEYQSRPLYLQVRSFFGLLGFFLRWTFKFIFLLVSFEAPQLLLNSSSFFSHLLSVLLVEQRELTAAYAAKTQFY